MHLSLSLSPLTFEPPWEGGGADLGSTPTYQHIAHFDMQKPFIIEVDASKFAFGSILSHQGDDGKLHLVAFHSRKFDTVEINYEVHDKELLTIVDSFAKWWHFLKDSPHQIIVFYSHKNLTYL